VEKDGGRRRISSHRAVSKTPWPLRRGSPSATIVFSRSGFEAEFWSQRHEHREAGLKRRLAVIEPPRLSLAALANRHARVRTPLCSGIEKTAHTDSVIADITFPAPAPR
jgi:hypothetical protein